MGTQGHNIRLLSPPDLFSGSKNSCCPWPTAVCTFHGTRTERLDVGAGIYGGALQVFQAQPRVYRTLSYLFH